ncbi:hypothetical protein LIER_13008 [Lithospermum erythrorhizon]|uniref:Uncharacterized protein n=1 Tax=Lithospermum erythrorhizon TaxID=34254 RepID=A0AAV3PYE6_LITER
MHTTIRPFHPAIPIEEKGRMNTFNALFFLSGCSLPFFKLILVVLHSGFDEGAQGDGDCGGATPCSAVFCFAP